MAKKSFAQKTQRTIVGAVKSRRVQRIVLKAAIAAATTAATAAAAAAVMKSAGGRKGQTQKTAAKRRSGRSRTRTSGTGQRKRR
jgi:ribosomal protein L12E/L44/L45/RPP1/RPP2